MAATLSTSFRVDPPGSPGSVLGNIEAISKVIAVAGVAIYICGFLIISLHHAQFGFLPTNPFRPRILSAGAWFVTFVGLPAAISLAYKREDLTWFNIGRNVWTIWISCAVISNGSQYLFQIDEYLKRPAPTWEIVLLGAGIILVVLALNWKKLPAYLAVTASILLVSYSLQQDIRELANHRFHSNAITTWAFVIALLSVIEKKIQPQYHGYKNVSRLLALSLVALSVFAYYYYPKLKASWGGGSPIEITVLFSKDSPVAAGQAVPAELIDESDSGFYIVANGDLKAMFLPRGAISAILFSKDPQNSQLFKLRSSAPK